MKHGQGPSGGGRIETAIVGGGQAGLAVGYHLASRDRPFVILDADQRVGDAWRRRLQAGRTRREGADSGGVQPHGALGLALGAQVDRPALQQRAQVEISQPDILTESAALRQRFTKLQRHRS
jgi:hypothetical protein